MIHFAIDQLGVAVFGTAAVFLSQDERPSVSKYACIAGLCGEPFWLWSAWIAQQWGVIVMVVIYTAGWSRGLWNFWIKPAWQKARTKV